MKHDKKEETEFIYIEGHKYRNPNYEGECENEDLSFAKLLNVEEIMKKISDPKESEEIKFESSKKIVQMISKVSLCPLFSKRNDKQIKKIMVNYLFKDSSGAGKLVRCPLCQNKKPDSNHYKKHKFIFNRGCIFCNKPLEMGNFREYSKHIEKHHPQAFCEEL